MKQSSTLLSYSKPWQGSASSHYLASFCCLCFCGESTRFGGILAVLVYEQIVRLRQLPNEKRTIGSRLRLGWSAKPEKYGNIILSYKQKKYCISNEYMDLPCTPG